MKKLVSVVVPVYNAENYLELCINSILNQTYKNLEIIFVNDGSTDNSLKILKKYAEEDSRIKLFNQKNSGGAATPRNKGLAKATGDYVVFVDSDDWIDKDYIKTLLKHVNNKVDIVLSGYKKVTGDKVRVNIPLNDNWEIFNYSATCGKLYKLEFLRKHQLKYNQQLIMEDVAFNINCYIKQAKYKIINYAGYNYNFNPSSVTNTAKDKSEQLVSALETFRSIEACCNNPRDNEDKKRYINFYILHFIYILNMCCRNSSEKFLLEQIDEFYNFLNSIDKKWYKVDQPKKDVFKRRFVLFTWKLIYKLKLKKLFVKIFLISNIKKTIKKIIGTLMLIGLIIGVSIYLFIDYKQDLKQEEEKRQEEIYENIVESYSTNVVTNKETYLYELKEGKYIESKKVSANFYLFLEETEIEDHEDTYFKLKDKEYYVYYEDITETETKDFDSRYKRFIPWNQSIKISETVPIHFDDDTYIYLDTDITYPIIIKEVDKYYVEYDNRLGYIQISDKIQVINENNSSDVIAAQVAVLCYHYTYSSAAGEYCPNGIICHDEPQIVEQFQYLSQNNWFTPTMEEFEMYLDGKIQLPKKSLVITIDDGYWVPRMSVLLTKYNLNGTLFLIGELGTYEQHKTNNLEVHSHTYALHDPGVCPGQQGSPIRCVDRETILADLTKSRETLNNSKVFCWPFYEYNDYAIGLVKEAGFTMAFKGDMTKAYPGINKFLIPRYTIINSTNLSQFISYIS